MNLPNGKLEFTTVGNRKSDDIKIFAIICIVLSFAYMFEKFFFNSNPGNPFNIALWFGSRGSWILFLAYVTMFRKSFSKLKTKLIFQSDHISIFDNKGNTISMPLDELTELKIVFSSYDHISGQMPFFGSPYKEVQGRGNTISFKQKGENNCFEFYVEKKISLILLYHLVHEWKKKGTAIDISNKAKW